MRLFGEDVLKVRLQNVILSSHRVGQCSLWFPDQPYGSSEGRMIQVRLQMGPNCSRGPLAEMRKNNFKGGNNCPLKGGWPCYGELLLALTASQLATYDESRKVMDKVQEETKSCSGTKGTSRDGGDRGWGGAGGKASKNEGLCRAILTWHSEWRTARFYTLNFRLISV